MSATFHPQMLHWWQCNFRSATLLTTFTARRWVSSPCGTATFYCHNHGKGCSVAATRAL